MAKLMDKLESAILIFNTLGFIAGTYGFITNRLSLHQFNSNADYVNPREARMIVQDLNINNKLERATILNYKGKSYAFREVDGNPAAYELTVSTEGAKK